MAIDQFRQNERDMIQHAIENEHRQLADEGYGFSDLPSSLQHEFTWDELKALLSALEGIRHGRIHPNTYIFPPEEYEGIWYETMMKVYALAMQHFSRLRVQPCRQEGCNGNLIFIKHDSPGKGKVPVTKLLPTTIVERMRIGITEDMLGYIIAMCPSCGYIQLYDAPDEELPKGGM